MQRTYQNDKIDRGTKYDKGSDKNEGRYISSQPDLTCMEIM